MYTEKWSSAFCRGVCHADYGLPRKRTPRIVFGNVSCRFRSPGSVTGERNAAVSYPLRPETVSLLENHSLSAEIEAILLLLSQWKSMGYPSCPEMVPSQKTFAIGRNRSHSASLFTIEVQLQDRLPVRVAVATRGMLS